jgi:predicted lipid carrier protein YhbT
MINELRFPTPASVLAWLPAPLLDAALAEALRVMRRRHPAAFDRLGHLGDKVIRIEPSDMPVSFTLALGTVADRPWLRVACPDCSAAAVIRGSFATLLDLLEGRSDGDGLFFARVLAVEGDMELVVGLRNAVDGEGIDVIDDLLSAFGPFGPPLSPIARLVRWTVSQHA